MTQRRLAALSLASLVALASCDKLQSINPFEPSWKPVDTNGQDGAFHFVVNPYDLRVGLPEHVRVERIERRTIEKPGGAKEEQERTRQVQVTLARCRPTSICDAVPHSDDTREIVVNPLMMGEATLEVTAAIDGKEEMKDSIKIKVSPR